MTIRRPRALTRTERFLVNAYHAPTLPTAIERAADACRPRGLFTESPHEAVNVDDIAHARHITVTPIASGSRCGEGWLIPERGGFVCRLAAGPRERRRFSLAHEIGHSLFYSAEGDSPQHVIGVLDRIEMQSEERICDALAGAILVPANSLTNAGVLPAPGSDPSPHDVLRSVSALARQYDVSLEVIIRRLGTVQPPSAPCVVVYMNVARSLRAHSHRLRVAAYCALGYERRLVLFPNRTASAIGLLSANQLLCRWRDTRQASAGGVFRLAGDGTLVEHTDCQGNPLVETVHVRRQLQSGWRETPTPFSIISDLHARRAATEREVCIVSALVPIGSVNAATTL